MTGEAASDYGIASVSQASLRDSFQISGYLPRDAGAWDEACGVFRRTFGLP